MATHTSFGFFAVRSGFLELIVNKSVIFLSGSHGKTPISIAGKFGLTSNHNSSYNGHSFLDILV